MSFFILQSMFLLLLCFVIGFLLGRFIKRWLCNRALLKGNAAVNRNEAYAEPDTTAKPEASTPAVAAGFVVKPNNLQIIEGIGPKMESVLNENDVVTWSDLAARTVPELRGILDKYGNRYQIIDPTTWLEQARLAAGGKVNELIKLQKIDGVSKLENLMYQGKKSGFARYKQNDLKIVEGIGPQIEALLNNSGIHTWRALSQAELSVIKTILRAAGPKYRLAVPESWMLQAKLADNGEWDKLKQCQVKLRDVRPSRAARETADAV